MSEKTRQRGDRQRQHVQRPGGDPDASGGLRPLSSPEAEPGGVPPGPRPAAPPLPPDTGSPPLAPLSSEAHIRDPAFSAEVLVKNIVTCLSLKGEAKAKTEF